MPKEENKKLRANANLNHSFPYGSHFHNVLLKELAAGKVLRKSSGEMSV